MCFDEEDCEVYIGDDGKIYSKMLNMCSIAMNNNKVKGNKAFLLTFLFSFMWFKSWKASRIEVNN